MGIHRMYHVHRHGARSQSTNNDLRFDCSMLLDQIPTERKKEPQSRTKETALSEVPHNGVEDPPVFHLFTQASSTYLVSYRRTR